MQEYGKKHKEASLQVKECGMYRILQNFKMQVLF